MSTIAERITNARTNVREVNRQHEVARKLLAELRAREVPPREFDALDMITNGLPDIEQEMSLRLRAEVEGEIRGKLNEFLKYQADHVKVAKMQDFDAVLVVLREEVARIFDAIPRVADSLSNVSNSTEAIERDKVTEWRELTALTTDLRLVADEYVAGALGSGYQLLSHEVHFHLFPRSQDHPLPYDAEGVAPIVNERYLLWLATLSLDEYATLLNLPDPEFLGSGKFLELNRGDA